MKVYKSKHGCLFTEDRIIDALEMVFGYNAAKDLADERIDIDEYVYKFMPGIETILNLDVKELLQMKHKVLAIKAYRQSHPQVHLIDAKHAVDKLEQELGLA